MTESAMLDNSKTLNENEGSSAPQGIEVQSNVAVIDVIRGLAALMVAFYHTREIMWVGIRDFAAQPIGFGFETIVSYLSIPFVWGSIGVPIFFVLSGYVIHRRSARDLAASNHANWDARQFLIRRFFRIYPTFFLALLLTLLCDTVSREYAPLNTRLGDDSFSSFLWNTFALQGVLGPSFGSNGALWTLAIEIQFYAFYPIALWMRRYTGLEVMLLLSLAITVVGAVTLESNGIILFPAYFFSWWLGAYIADREAAGRNALPGAVLVGSVFIAVGCVCVVTHVSSYFAHMAWAIGFTFVLDFLVRRKPATRRSLAARALGHTGNYSYSLYAVHMPIVIMISSIWFGGAKHGNILVATAVFIAVIVLSFVFYQMAERPFIKLLRSIPRRKAS